MSKIVVFLKMSSSKTLVGNLGICEDKQKIFIIEKQESEKIYSNTGFEINPESTIVAKKEEFDQNFLKEFDVKNYNEMIKIFNKWYERVSNCTFRLKSFEEREGPIIYTFDIPEMLLTPEETFGDFERNLVKLQTDFLEQVRSVKNEYLERILMLFERKNINDKYFFYKIKNFEINLKESSDEDSGESSESEDF